MFDSSYIVLVDNLVGDSNDLMCEHGLSILCTFNNRKILIDTGAGEALFHNAAKMHVDLTDVDYAVITHGHNDHSGGLYKFLNINSKATVFLKRSAVTEDHFLFDKKSYIDIGVNREILHKFEERINLIDKELIVGDALYLISVDTNECPFYSTNSMLYIKDDDHYVSDDFEHELIVVIDLGSYVDVITGCSHSGIVNMVKTVQRRIGKKIRYLFGGFHTGDIPKYDVKGINSDELEQLASFLSSADIGKVFTMHCTGKTYYDRLRAQLGAKIEYAYAGTSM